MKSHITLLLIAGWVMVVGSDSWETIIYATSHLWMTWTLVSLLMRVIKLVEEDTCTREHLGLLLHQNINCTVIAVISAALLIYFGEELFNEYTLPIAIVCCLTRISEMTSNKDDVPKQIKTIGYGAGMACSFFEGYLNLILPSTGLTTFLGFQENIRVYESTHSVTFPVKKLFLIISKSLYSPPDLKDFKNSGNGASLEACMSLEHQMRDIAGVKNRVYKNSVYMIKRPGNLASVFIAAECATPIHTLYNVKKHRALYKDLADADFNVIEADFRIMLEKILQDSEECRDNCVIVSFDDTKENLAEVLLRKIKQLKPDFEEVMQHREDY